MQSYHTGTKEITLRAPAGGVVGGQFYLIGAFFGQAMTSVAEGRPFTLNREDIFAENVEAVGADIAPGDYIYWNAGRADAEFHNDSAEADARLVGIAMGNVADTTTNMIDVSIERYLPAAIGAGDPTVEAVEFVDGQPYAPTSSVVTAAAEA